MNDPDPDIGRSDAVTAADERWAAAGTELTPASSLARLDDRAKQVVTSVSLVGSVLTGLGLIAAGRLIQSPSARWLAVGAIGLAILAVVVALATLLLRLPTLVAPADVAAVRRLYQRQFGRARAVVASAALLIAALVLAGAAATAVLLGTAGGTPTFAATVVGTGPDAVVRVRADFAGLPAGQLITTVVTGVDPDRGRIGLARDTVVTGTAGTALVNLEVKGVSQYATIDIAVESPTMRCDAAITPSDPAINKAACQRRQ